jgi:hypothetical protein
MFYSIVWHPIHEKMYVQTGDLNYLELKCGIQVLKTFTDKKEAESFLNGMQYIIEGFDLKSRIVNLFKLS